MSTTLHIEHSGHKYILLADDRVILYTSDLTLVKHYARAAQQHYATSSLPYTILPMRSASSTSSASGHWAIEPIEPILVESSVVRTVGNSGAFGSLHSCCHNVNGKNVVFTVNHSESP